MARLAPVLIGLSVAGIVIALARESMATVFEDDLTKSKSKKKSSQKTSKSSGSFAERVGRAARNLSSQVIASARKWSTKRGIPLIDVLTTIVLESGGNPKAHALSSKEDSRGLMQVNIRAHGDALKKLGYKADDLYKLDVGVEVGTYIYASKLKAVQGLVRQSKRQQEYDIPTLTRLYYAGPKYAKAWILKGTHFKNMEAYVDHWLTAKKAVSQATYA